MSNPLQLLQCLCVYLRGDGRISFMLSRKIRMSLQRPAGSSQAALVSGNCWFMRSPPPFASFSSSPPLPTPPFSSLILRIFWKNSHNPLFTFAAESNLSKVKGIFLPQDSKREKKRCKTDKKPFLQSSLRCKFVLASWNNLDNSLMNKFVG